MKTMCSNDLKMFNKSWDMMTFQEADKILWEKSNGNPVPLMLKKPVLQNSLMLWILVLN